MLTVGRDISQCPEMTRTALGRMLKLPSMPRRYAANPSHMCGSLAGGSMKKHGPPPCGMYNVGNLLMAFTDVILSPFQPSRAGIARQLHRAPPALDDGSRLGGSRSWHDGFRGVHPLRFEDCACVRCAPVRSVSPRCCSRPGAAFRYSRSRGSATA